MSKLRPLLFAFATMVCPSLFAQTYEVIIRSGHVIDGAGNPWIKADVGIRGGRVVRIGRLDDAQASQVIDAAGQVVTPGFIDMHTHSEYPLLYDGNAQSKIRQGVTTEVVGEGTSPSPIEGPAVEPAKEVLRTYKIDLMWNTLDGYFQRLLKSGSSVNVASYVSSCQVRYDVIGFESRPPTGDELEKMRQLVSSTMEQGAFGLTNALEATCGYAKTDELIELAKVVSRYGGIYATHARGEGDTVLDSVREAIEIGEKANVPVEIFHLKVAGSNNWGRMPEVIALINSARARGVDVNANQYPYIAANHPTLPLLPPWALEGGVDKTMERLRDPLLRARMKHDIEDGLHGWNSNYVRQSGGWQGIVIGGTRTERNASLAGKTLEELGRARDKDAADAFFDLLLEEHGQVMCMPFMMNEKDVQTALREPWLDIASDGSSLSIEGLLAAGHPHPRNFGTFPRILGHYVRDEKVLTLEDAVRRMTSLAAQRLGLKDRGLLREGYWADVVVFDPNRISDRATFERPKQYPEGVNYVLVNGRVVIDRGNHTGERPGMALRGPGFGARKSGSVAQVP
ncbi:MAG TPA: D-aminoacylase [Candidatus Acidoferrum sp.]